MDQSTRQDIKLSFLVGLLAGILMLPILNNLHFSLTALRAIIVVAGLTLFTPAGYMVAYWISGRWPVMIQFVKFGIVGGLNSLLYLGALNLLITVTGVATGLGYTAFVSSAFVVAVVNSYVWNKYWVFRASQSGGGSGEFIKFVLVNLVGFLINVGAASFVVNVIGAPIGISPSVWANIGAVSAVFITLFWNFIGMKFIVFKR